MNIGLIYILIYMDLQVLDQNNLIGNKNYCKKINRYNNNKKNE